MSKPSLFGRALGLHLSRLRLGGGAFARAPNLNFSATLAIALHET